MGEPAKFTPHPNLGMLIHNTRKARDLTLNEVAAQLGIGQPYLHKIEAGGAASTGFVLICRISDVLRIPMTHLKAAALEESAPAKG